MSTPNGGLITETNRQYYAGAQQKNIIATAANQTITSTFDTYLVVGTGNYSDPGTNGYNLNNFKIYTSPNAQTWTELTPTATSVDALSSGISTAGQTNLTIVTNVAAIGGNLFSVVDKSTGVNYGTIVSKTTAGGVDTLVMSANLPTGGVVNNTQLSIRRITTWTMVGNTVTVIGSLTSGTYLKIQMNQNTMHDNNGSYEYTRLVDVIDNFLIAYVGAGKLIPSVKRSDVIFHAKRGLQEFSYDTLKSVRSQELTVNYALNVIIPQDYVNYVRFSWIDGLGVQHTIYPANELTTNPFASPVQDEVGTPTQDSQDSNIQGSSQTEAAWDGGDPRKINGAFSRDVTDASVLMNTTYDGMLGQRYGLEPQTSQKNGWFTINEREGVFSFSSELKDQIIVLEYISDGNAYDLDARIPKLAEEALYAHMMYSILSTSAGIQEYVVRRFKQERSAKLRNAKIRLSNLKSAEMIQTMRGQSKWLKY